MIYALTIRSPVPRGIIRAIECPKLPNSYCIVTAEYIPGKNSLADFAVPILAAKSVSYAGQPLAILAGPDKSKLLELSSRIKVSIETEKAELPSEKDAPEENLSDIIVSRNIVSGDPEKLPYSQPDETGKIITGTYFTGIQEHFYPEPNGAVVIPQEALPVRDKKNSTGSLIIHTATQWPFHVQRSVALVLGLDSAELTVNPAKMAEHLDGKIWYPSLISCHAALAAWISKKPVKLVLTREEDFLYSPKRNSSEISIKSVIKETGKLSGSQINVNLNLGAEGIFEDEIMDETCLGALGVYEHSALRINGIGKRTNIPPQGPMAGFGLSQGFFAAELQASRIADSLGIDPAEWRKSNFIGRSRSLVIGTTLKEEVHLAELIDAAAAMSDYYRKWSSYELLRIRRRETSWEFRKEPLRGIGISIAFQGNGFLYNDESGNGNCTVELTLEKDGSLEIKTSLVSAELEYKDIWHDLIRESLGVDPSMTRIVNNPGDIPDSGLGTLSRNIGVITKLVERCCNYIRKQRFRRPLPINVKRSWRPAAEPGWVPGKNIDPEAFSSPSWGAAVAEIEIDPVMLEPLCRGIWLVVDGGKILSQRRARRTLKTGIIQALGWASREQVSYVEGKIPFDLYLGYNIPSPAEIPRINVDFIWNDSVNPKGIGDLPFSCVPAAFVQAVSQAMDHPFAKIPLDARDIWDAGKLKSSAQSAEERTGPDRKADASKMNGPPQEAAQ